jgi:adenine C2-methylase RlmN of 23S rRNA A2503 and tRNA A37
MGEIGNLLCGEIVEQLLHARKFSEIRNVVFMGLGNFYNNNIKNVNNNNKK